MSTAWIVIVVLVSLATAVITAMPGVAWLRRRARRKKLLARFLEELAGASQVEYRRMNRPFGKGFADSYRGRTQGFAFFLTAGVIPRAERRPFSLTLETETGEPKRLERWEAQADPEGRHPLALAAAALRLRRPNDPTSN